MIYHIVAGDEAAGPLKEAIKNEAAMSGEVVALKDILHVGPIQKNAGQSFSTLRNDWWQSVQNDPKNANEVNDLERLLQISNELNKNPNDQIWIWMAPAPADVCAYYWMLPYIAKHNGRIFIVNLANLPFLNESGGLFYPKSISELLPKELIKARKLARPLTLAEMEADEEYWQKLVDENAGIRTLEGGKKFFSRHENFYDAQIISILQSNFQKASRVISQAASKFSIPTGDIFLAWRLLEMAKNGLVRLKGDTTKSYRDWEVSMPASESAEAPADQDVTSQHAI